MTASTLARKTGVATKKAGKPVAGKRLRMHRMAGLEQVRALSHPLRLRLLELFAECPRTAKQAAETLGEAPTRLYHHVAALEQAGLIRLKETRPNRGATEKYFEAVAHRYEAGPGAVGAGRKSAGPDHAAMGFVLFDRARQELVEALAAGSGGRPEVLMAVRGVFHLTPASARRLVKELQAAMDRLRTGADKQPRGSTSARRHRYSLTIALLPAADSPEKS